MSGRRALIFEKNLHRAAELRRILEDAGWVSRAVFYPAEAETVFSKGEFDLLIAGFDVFPLPPALTGIHTLITAPNGRLAAAEEAMTRYGLAGQVVCYPFAPEEVARKIEGAVAPKESLPAVSRDIPFMLGKSEAMREAKELLLRAAQAPSTVLILGETGTGKELAARALHEFGPRKAGPFVAVNCAALPETLLETELFGHERGAFTGAERRKLGRFESAHSGTIFLDEIGDMPASLQVKLLRVLETRSFFRVGGEVPVTVDVRVVCATNQDIFEMAREGAFRLDLLYRINVIAVRLPALRDRMEDLPLLAEHFLKKYSVQFRKAITGFSSEVISVMARYRWPGNVRQLEHAVERAAVECRGNVVTDMAFEREEGAGPSVPPEPGSLARLDYATMKEKVLEFYEKEYLSSVLLKANGNIQEASEHSGMDRKTLYRKMKQYGLDKKDYK